MVRRISSAQLRSQLRQAEHKHRQAVNQQKQAVRRQSQKFKQAVNNLDNAVRRYNSQTQANRRKIESELRRLESSLTARNAALRVSSVTLSTRFQALQSSAVPAEFVRLSEHETESSLVVANALESDETQGSDPLDASLQSTLITTHLSSISPDLDDRWRGALFALSSDNPDASRHFCASAREIFVTILDHFAPDKEVSTRFPLCDLTPQGYPTRRWKVKYMLVSTGVVSEEAIDFVDEDISNVLELFRVFNDGTHGRAGRFGLSKLAAIKERVESGIVYLTTINRSGQ